MSVSGIVRIYADLIEAKQKTLEDVPERIRSEVEAELERRIK